VRGQRAFAAASFAVDDCDDWYGNFPRKKVAICNKIDLIDLIDLIGRVLIKNLLLS